MKGVSTHLVIPLAHYELLSNIQNIQYNQRSAENAKLCNTFKNQIKYGLMSGSSHNVIPGTSQTGTL